MYKRSLSILGLLVIASLYSCKKNGGSAQNCNLVALVDSTSTVQATTTFTYDASNRITQVVVTGQKACKRTYQYLGSNIIIFNVTDTSAGIATETDTLFLNNKNLIEKQNTYYPNAGVSIHENYTYDDAGNAVSSYETINGTPGDSMEYVTTSGDLTYEKVKGTTIHKNDFTYYGTKDIVFGDPTDFRQLFYYGAYYYRNKHLLNELIAPGISYKGYSYTFAGNRISQAKLRQWTAAAPDTITHYINYFYSCK